MQNNSKQSGPSEKYKTLKYNGDLVTSLVTISHIWLRKESGLFSDGRTHGADWGPRDGHFPSVPILLYAAC